MRTSIVPHPHQPAFVVSVLDVDHSKTYEIVSCFNLCFSADLRCGVSFNMPICHLYVFGEVSGKVFGPFLNLVCYFELSGLLFWG